MTLKRVFFGLFALVFVLSLTACQAEVETEPEGAAEEIGEGLDNAADDLREGARDAREEMEDAAEDAGDNR